MQNIQCPSGRGVQNEGERDVDKASLWRLVPSTVQEEAESWGAKALGPEASRVIHSLSRVPWYLTSRVGPRQTGTCTQVTCSIMFSSTGNWLNQLYPAPRQPVPILTKLLLCSKDNALPGRDAVDMPYQVTDGQLQASGSDTLRCRLVHRCPCTCSSPRPVTAKTPDCASLIGPSATAPRQAPLELGCRFW